MVSRCLEELLGKTGNTMYGIGQTDAARPMQPIAKSLEMCHFKQSEQDAQGNACKANKHPCRTMPPLRIPNALLAAQRQTRKHAECHEAIGSRE